MVKKKTNAVPLGKPGRKPGSRNIKINAAQIAFAVAYAENGFCQSVEAYIKAYPKSASWKRSNVTGAARRLLEHPLVWAEIEAARQSGARVIMQAADRWAVSKETIIRRFAEIAFSQMTDFISWGKDGKIQMVDFTRLEPASKSAISRIRWSENKDVRGIELHDQQAALMNLARLHDLLRVEMADKGGGEDPIVIELRHTARRSFIDHLNNMERQLKKGKIVDVETP